METKRIFYSLLFLLLAIRLQGQKPSYTHYNTADGLPSAIVYQVLQDDEGYIWFATANGISRFDGKHFKTFQTRHGLNSNSNTCMAKGKDGMLFVGNYEKGINIIQGDQISSFISKINGQQFSVSKMLVDKSLRDGQHVYAYRSWSNINILIESGGKLSEVKIINFPIYLLKLEQLFDGRIVLLSTKGLFLFQHDSLSKLRIKGLPDESYFCLSSVDSSRFLLGAKGMIYEIENSKVKRAIQTTKSKDGNVGDLFQDSKGNIWFSVVTKGFYCIPAGGNEIVDMGIALGLDHTVVNGFMEDREGNIWINSNGKGVFCLNNADIKTLDESNGLGNSCVYSLAMDHTGCLLAGTLDGLYRLKNGSFLRVQNDYNKTLTEYIHSVKTYKDDVYICSGYLGDNNRIIVRDGINFHLLGKVSFCRATNGWNYSGVGFNNVRAYMPGSIQTEKTYTIIGDSIRVNRVNEIFEDSKNRLWIGTSEGLCLVSNPMDTSETGEWKRDFFPNNTVLSARINAIIEGPDHSIWCAGERGIANINLHTNEIRSFKAIEGRDLSYATSLCILPNGHIFIGTLNGLFAVQDDEVWQLDKKSGLPAGEVNALYFDTLAGNLYVGTSNGIAIIDIGMFDSYPGPAPDMKINEIKAGNTIFKDFSNLQFKPGQRNVFIGFTALHFAWPASLKYQYKLNNEWETTDHDFLDLVSLHHGTYHLQLRARSQNTDWGKPVELTFTVLPEFVETGIFYLLIFASLLAAVVFTGLWRKRLFIQKTREKREIAERFNQLKHEALSAMMNPHFISNALNSVQYLVNSGKTEEANDYIAMIAKLMRKNLDTAGNGYILLSEEIGKLKLYLELEKLRLQNRFQYTINTTISADTILIPNMIVQPFAENALWHGLIHSDRMGTINISFEIDTIEKDDIQYPTMLIKITDNGIGIRAAQQMKKDDHISKGIQIIEERLSLLCANLQLSQPIIFEDLANSNTGAQGTEVIISLPPPLYQVLSKD